MNLEFLSIALTSWFCMCEKCFCTLIIEMCLQGNDTQFLSLGSVLNVHFKKGTEFWMIRCDYSHCSGGYFLAMIKLFHI